MNTKNHYDELGGYARNLIKHKARQIIGKAGFQASDLEDIEQELAIDLHIRLPKYDPRRARKTTFMARIVEHKLSALITERHAQCRDWRRCRTSLDEPPVSGDDPNDDPLAEQISDEAIGSDEVLNLMVDLREALDTMPDDLRHLWDCLLTGNIRRVSKDLGIPRTTLYGRLKKLRALLAEAGLGDYVA